VNNIFWENRFRVPLGGVRGEFVARERACAVLKGGLFFG